MINAIRGGKGFSNVSFEKSGSHGFMAESLNYENFNVQFVDIIDYKPEKPENGVRLATLECGLYFGDALGRAAYVRVLAEYVVMPKHITIINSEYELLPDPNPRLAAFILPHSAVDKMPSGVKKDFTKLYKYAFTNAVNMTPTQEEQAIYDEYKQLSSISRLGYKSAQLPESYRVMVFCMDRLRPDSRFVLSVANSEKVTGKSLATPYYLNDHGWMVGIVGGKFALDAFNKSVFFHVQYDSGIKTNGGNMKQVARFSSIKNYDKTINFHQKNPYVVAWQKGGTDDQLAAGELLLNPGVTADARVIQQRLAVLGFYSMTVDGAFGSGSKKSLKAFKTAQGLGADSNWNLTTQKALFQ